MKIDFKKRLSVNFRRKSMRMTWIDNCAACGMQRISVRAGDCNSLINVNFIFTPTTPLHGISMLMVQ